MSIKYCIPSYRRPKFPALEWLLEEGVSRKDIILFLHSYDEKLKYLGTRDLEGIEIILTGSKNMRDQRNFIMQSMFRDGEYVMIDDDVTGIKQVQVLFDKYSLVKVRLKKIVKEMFSLARKNKCKLWGTGIYRNPYFAGKMQWCDMGKFFRNNLVGVQSYFPRKGLQFPVGTDWELGLCALRDGVRAMRFNWNVLDVMLGVDKKELGGIGSERYRFTGSFFRKMALYYIREGVSRKVMGKFCPALIQCLDRRWKHTCSKCGDGFFDNLHFKLHQIYPCK